VTRSNLNVSLSVLTDSLVESVMQAIRLASLEELGGAYRPSAARTRRPSLDAIDAGPFVQAGSDAHTNGIDLEPNRDSERVARPREARAQTRRRVERPTVTARIADLAPPEATAEITDPQMLLGLGYPDVQVEREPEAVPEPEPSSRVRANGGSPPMRLRDNETLARVSNAGVVIRRAK
jgi:hypothetical protein